MRPGNGATNVPANTVVTLFTNAAMNPATVTGALHVTDNGVVVSGTVQLFSNGQAIEFTPAAAFNPGDLIQVFLDSTALSADGVALSSFSGQFTVAGSPANTAAAVQAVNPFPNATQCAAEHCHSGRSITRRSLASTVNSTNVMLYAVQHRNLPDSDDVAGGQRQVINIVPTSNLTGGIAVSA